MLVKNLPSGYSAKILEHSVDDVSGDIQSKLQMGTYSTRTILFDPFNCYYEVITKEAEKTEQNLKTCRKKIFQNSIQNLFVKVKNKNTQELNIC